MMRSAALVAVGVLWLAACGDTATESSVDSVPGADASNGATAAATAPPAGDDDEACPSDLRTFEVAMEAYDAQFDRYPDQGADLVAAELLRLVAPVRASISTRLPHRRRATTPGAASPTTARCRSRSRPL